MTTMLAGPVLLTLVLVVPLVLLLDVWLVRLAWQAATRPMAGDLPPQKEPPPFRATATNSNQRYLILVVILAFVGMLLLAITLAVGVLGAYWLMPLPSKPSAPQIVEPQFRTMEAATPPEQVTGPERIEGEPAKLEPAKKE